MARRHEDHEHTRLTGDRDSIGEEFAEHHNVPGHASPHQDVMAHMYCKKGR